MKKGKSHEPSAAPAHFFYVRAASINQPDHAQTPLQVICRLPKNFPFESKNQNTKLQPEDERIRTRFHRYFVAR